MKVGTSLKSGYVTRDAREGARHMVERARASYEAGLDSLFVGDHHSVPVPYYQNVPMLGRLLAEWHGRTAGALLLLPLWNPVLAAEQLGTLAAIHDGPFVLQCALGGGESQFAAMGTDLRHRPSRFEAASRHHPPPVRGRNRRRRRPVLRRQHAISPVPPEPVEVWIGGVGTEGDRPRGRGSETGSSSGPKRRRTRCAS